MGWLDWLFGKRQKPVDLSAQNVTFDASMSATGLSMSETHTASSVAGQSLNYIVNTVHLPPDVGTYRIPDEEMRAIAAREAEEAKANTAAQAHAERLANVPRYPRTRDCYHPNYRAEYNAVAVHIAEYPADLFLRNLCEEFRSADLVRMRAIVAEYAGYEDLLDFALRMANKAMRERSAECVLNGMTAICIENETFEPRESYACSEGLRVAAEMIGPQVLNDCYSRIVEIAKRVPCNTGAITYAVRFRQFVWFE